VRVFLLVVWVCCIGLLLTGIRRGITGTAVAPQTKPVAPSIVVPAHTNLPPGYALEVNQAGLYRPIYADTRTVLFWLDGPANTRQKAVDAAWSQYKWEHPAVTDVWRVVECKTEGGAK
jgi:hypothetical protein